LIFKDISIWKLCSTVWVSHLDFKIQDTYAKYERFCTSWITIVLLFIYIISKKNVKKIKKIKIRFIQFWIYQKGKKVEKKYDLMLKWIELIENLELFFQNQNYFGQLLVLFLVASDMHISLSFYINIYFLNFCSLLVIITLPSYWPRYNFLCIIWASDKQLCHY
jgi:hypothetical protein